MTTAREAKPFGHRRLEKPDFRVSGTGWIDNEFLPRELRAALTKIASRAHSAADAARLVAATSNHVQMILESVSTVAPAGRTRDSFDVIATRARALQQAIAALAPADLAAFAAHWDYLAFGTAPPVELAPLSRSMRSSEGAFLSAAWDFISDVEAASEYAAHMCKPSRQDQASRALARGLVANIAADHARMFGRLPPYSKETWFPDYVSALFHWERLELRCGAALVASAVRSVAYPS